MILRYSKSTKCIDKVASYNHSGYKKNLFLNFILSVVVASGGDVALRKVRRLLLLGGCQNILKTLITIPCSTIATWLVLK